MSPRAAPLLAALAVLVPAAAEARSGVPVECGRLRRAVESRVGTGSGGGQGYEEGSFWPVLAEAARCRSVEHLRDAAEMRALIGDYPGAERDFRAALSLAPGDAESALGLALAIRDRPADALPFAVRASEASAPLVRARALRLAGELQADLGDAAAARASLEKSLAGGTEDLESLRELVRLERARPDRARAWAARASRTAAAAPAWCRGEALRAAARARADAGDAAGAAADLRAALALEPDDADALRDLARLPAGAASAAAPGAAPEPLPPLEGSPEALAAALDAAKGKAARRAAAELLADAVASAPAWQREPAYRLLAREWKRLREPARAEASLHQARQLSFDSLETARLSVEIERGSTSREQQLEALAQGWMAAGLAHQELGDDLRALHAFERAVEARPGNGWMRAQRDAARARFSGVTGAP